MSDEREEALKWLRYWVVLAVFSLAETVADPLFDFFPGYLLGKCVFLVWCMLPTYGGANLLFTKVSNMYTYKSFIIFFQIIFPLFKKHHEEIDQQAQIVHDSVMQKVNRYLYGKQKTW